MSNLKKKNSNLSQLHILRGFAALYVVIGHAKVVFWVGGREYLNKYPREGWGITEYLNFVINLCSSSAQELVVVFFVLSGFFIGYSFKKNNWKFQSFLVNRIIRIYPPYLFSVVFSVLVFYLIIEIDSFYLLGEVKHQIAQRASSAYKELSWGIFL